jgi:hypothetical protein
MQLDYGLLVRRSLGNAWNCRFLWLFGFFAAASDSVSGLFNFNLQDTDFVPFDFKAFFVLWIILIAVFLGLLSFIMGTISEGALIHGIREKNAGRKVSFGQCWSAGIDRFWRLLVILILLTLSILFSVIVMAMVVVPGFIASTLLGVILLLLVIPLIIVVVFVVESVAAWSIRFGVIDNIPWNKALESGWRLFSTNPGKSFAVAMSSVLTQIVVTLIAALAALVLAVPFILIGFANLAAGILLGTLVGVPLVVVYMAAMGVFQSSIWTLAFLEMTDRQESSPQIAIEPDVAI